MKPILGGAVGPIYAIFRLVAGLMFSVHGAQKLFGVLGGTAQPMFSQLWFGGIIELCGGLLVAFGLFTSYAAFLCSGMMAVAYFQAHAPRGPWPILNAGELAALYCFTFLYIAARGGGPWSLDRK